MVCCTYMYFFDISYSPMVLQYSTEKSIFTLFLDYISLCGF